MKTTIIIIIIIINLFSCNKRNEYTEYYQDGNIKLKIYEDPENAIKKIQEEFYQTGQLKTISHSINGISVDTIYFFFKNKKIKEKGLYKNNLNNGWWIYYDSLGNLESKKEYVIINNISHLNQFIKFDKNKDTLFNSSSFFKIYLPDTLSVGKNVGKIKYHSNISSKEKFFYILIDNQVSDNKIIKDTFNQEKNITRFGIFAHKKGLKKVKGVILETTLMLKKGDKADNSSLTINNYKRYFEKEVFVKK